MKPWPYLLIACVMVVTFGCRWLGPSDLYDNDQPKTVAYTVDMVRHGRWVLPQDMLSRPATKPPMYNWLGVPAVAAGWHSEFALKLPSTLAAMATILLTWGAARRAARGVIDSGEPFSPGQERVPAGLPIAVASTACICFLANYSITKLCYTARPDMLLTAFMTGGWVAGSLLLTGYGKHPDKHATPSETRTTGRVLGMQAALWLCVAGAALTKGLPALLLVIYVVLGAKWIGGRWSAMRDTGIAWGLPLALGLIGLWVYSAYHADPEHFASVFLGAEVVSRIGRGGVVGTISEFWKMPAWFMVRFAPWSLFVLTGAVQIVTKRPRARWLANPLGPSLLWVILVLVFFSFSGGKRADYLAPAIPAGAVLASFWLVHEGRRWRMDGWRVAAAGLVVSFMLAGYEFTASPAKREGYGENLKAFVRQVRQQTDGQALRFEKTGYTPVQALLGYNQSQADDSSAGPKTLSPPWLIKPLDGPGAVVTSLPVSEEKEHPAAVLGLYAVEPFE